MPVYFVRAGTDGPVKIGHSANVHRRIKSIQGVHYRELLLIREVPGNETTERAFHWFFREMRIRGEWYEYCDAMTNIDVEYVINEMRVVLADSKGRNNTRPIHIYMPAELRAQIGAAAKRDRRSVSQWLIVAAEDRLQAERAKEEDAAA